jgi:hypothetical protein
LQDGATLRSVGDTPSSFDPEVTLREQAPERLSVDPPATEILDARAMPTIRTGTPAQTEHIRSRATDNARQDISPAPKPSSPALIIAAVSITTLLVLGAGLGLVLWLRRAPAGNANMATGQGNAPAAANQNTGATGSANGNRSTAQNRITATASSTRPALAGNTYEADKVLDGRLMTAWVEGVSGPGLGEWIRCDFEREVTLQRVSIAPGYFKSQQIWARNNRVAAATLYFSDGNSRQFRFPDRMEEQLLELGAVRTSWVRIVIDEVYAGADPDTAISQLAFEWER